MNTHTARPNNEPYRPLLAITMGDPAGIGPEVCVRALTNAQTYQHSRPLVVGDFAAFTKVMAACPELRRVKLNRVNGANRGNYHHGAIDLLDLGLLTEGQVRFGEVSAAQGHASFVYVTSAIELALAGKVDAIVTGPINKEAINLAGHRYAGHTEIFAEFTATADYAMMLCEGDFRVAHVSTHVSLREACDRVTTQRVAKVIELTHQSLLLMGIDQPRIAVAGLNPHCSEGGLFGREEAEEISPAIDLAQAAGHQVHGPIPADTVFSKMKGGMYDAVVVMYHDQGHIPTKLTGFRYDHRSQRWLQMAGVNLTLGLPIIRCSVDHGTAFDIAGTCTANEQSLGEAIRMAARLASAGRSSTMEGGR